VSFAVLCDMSGWVWVPVAARGAIAGVDGVLCGFERPTSIPCDRDDFGWEAKRPERGGGAPGRGALPAGSDRDHG
jgi:hypothetical protein